MDSWLSTRPPRVVLRTFWGIDILWSIGTSLLGAGIARLLVGVGSFLIMTVDDRVFLFAPPVSALDHTFRPPLSTAMMDWCWILTPIILSHLEIAFSLHIRLSSNIVQRINSAPNNNYKIDSGN
ncbi:hypothetical protein CEXT_674451 [Caerostris extrusa]|uniref:Uncharacterized protein n=1 Tax=Caerostris extrusa TaxID=172846 RepID=A0AAV4S4K6_CAEEX|nr:hypothetical protein CEXT_674451 [Caerostris extrusa]